MLAAFLLLATLRPEKASLMDCTAIKVSDEERGFVLTAEGTHQDQSSSAWLLNPNHKRPLHTPEAHRLRKHYRMSLLQVATGNYETHTLHSTTNSGSPIAPTISDTRNCVPNTLILHPVCGGGNGRVSINIKCDVFQDIKRESKEVIPTPSPLFPQDAIGSIPTNVGVNNNTIPAASEPMISPVPKSPVVPSWNVGEVAAEGLDAVQIAETAKAKARLPPIKTKRYMPTPRPSSTQTKVAFLTNDSQLATCHIAALDAAEDEFDGLNNELEAAPAPIFQAQHFGCPYDIWCMEDYGDQQEATVQYPLALYRAICAAKQERDIDEFNTTALVDGEIEPDTNEADFMEQLSVELRRSFILYLEHLANLESRCITWRKWKAGFRLQRTEAEFEDNACLRSTLKRENPNAPIPDGRNPMIQEYWHRRDLDFETMVAEYFYYHREYAITREDEWLTDEGEWEVNRYKYIIFDEPVEEPWDLEIEELEQLLIQEVDHHPGCADEKVLVRGYEAWEPIEPFGDEAFPDCAQGDEAYECLKNYQSNDYPPDFLEWQAEQARQEQEQLKIGLLNSNSMESYGRAVLRSKSPVSIRNDSLSPAWKDFETGVCQ